MYSSGRRLNWDCKEQVLNILKYLLCLKNAPRESELRKNMELGIPRDVEIFEYEDLKPDFELKDGKVVRELNDQDDTINTEESFNNSR
mmetsp:Transcript_42506/g.40760  ORF Transcript_42506/g.40760 Transcript_42506/m.40760 type:complete len:88 (+) Transcript_42506:990-1253(+)